MMSNDVMKVEVMPECCCICGLAGELATPEEYDAASGSAAPLRTALLHLNNNKVVPEGRLCGSCAQRAIDAHDFSSSLSARTATPLSEKIRALRRRLHDLTQKIDVFIVVGGPGATGSYSEEDIIMVERGALAPDAPLPAPPLAPLPASLPAPLLAPLPAPHSPPPPPLPDTRGDHVYQCSVCPMSFPSVEEYSAHCGTHPPMAARCCWVCGAQFPGGAEGGAALAEHAREHLLDDTTCHLCQTTFKSSLQLRAHCAGGAGGAGVCAGCPVCGERAPSRAALAAHAQRHPALCPVCFLQLPGEEALAGHALSHRSSRRFVCAVGECVLRFTKREHLLNHLRTHHHQEQAEEAVHADFACDTCGRTFASQAALKRHARVHKDEEQQTQMQTQEYAPVQIEEKVEYQWEEGIEGEEVEYLEIETLDEEIVE